MSNFKTGYYSADSINGVQYFGDALEDGNIDVLLAREFAESLDSICDGEVIYAYFTNGDLDLLDDIDDEYGVNQ